MEKSLLFYVLMLIWLLVGIVPWRKADRAGVTIRGIGSDLLIFAIILLVGWQVFGQPIK